MSAPQLLIDCGTIIASAQNKSDSITPYATVDLSNIDVRGEPDIKIIPMSTDDNVEDATEVCPPEVANEVIAEEIEDEESVPVVTRKRRRTENAASKITSKPKGAGQKYVQFAEKYLQAEGVTKSPVTFGDGVAYNGLGSLTALRDKKMTVHELQKHINIPGLTEKLKEVTKETGKVKIVIMKKKKSEDEPARKKNIKYVMPNKKKGKNARPKKKVPTKEYLNQPLENASGPLYQMWNLDENQWSAIKEDMKTFMKNTPYDPNKTFSDVVKEFMAFRGTNAPIPLLQRDHRPDTVVSKFNYGICCVIPQCNNAFFRSGADWSAINSQKSFFSFPNDRKMAIEWVRGIKRPLLKSIPHQELITYRVCEDHFDTNDFEDTAKTELSPNAIPKAPRTVRKSRRRLYVCPTLEQIEERREQIQKEKELGLKRKRNKTQTRRTSNRKRELEQEEELNTEKSENSDDDESNDDDDSDHTDISLKQGQNNKIPLEENPILNMTSFDEAVFFESDNAQEVVIEETL